MSDLRFSLLLKAAMENYGVGSTKLAELLNERGVYNITNKRISEYVRAVSTPSLEKAQILLDTLEFPLSEKALRGSLELNRELIKEEKEEQALLEHSGYGRTLNVHIRLRNLVPGQSTLDNERRVYDRIDDLYGSRDLVKYVEKLIAADLQHAILKGDSDNSCLQK